MGILWSNLCLHLFFFIVIKHCGNQASQC